MIDRNTDLKLADAGVLVIDAGTSSIRCHLFDIDGFELSVNRVGWPASTAPSDLLLAREFDPEMVLKAVYRLIRNTLKGFKINIRAVAVTSMRQAIVLLDHTDQPIYMGPNIDLRALFEGSAIDEEHRGFIYETTGHLPSFLFSPAKMIWFRNNRPELFNRLKTAVTIPDFLIHKLTGRLASEKTLAAEAGLLDIHNRQWATSVTNRLGLPFDSAVPFVNAGETTGLVTKEAAAETGIPVNTPVVSAGADTQCAAIGLGVTEPGHVSIVAGWSAPVQQVTDIPKASEHYATWIGCHLMQDRWIAESSAGDTGRVYSWIAETTDRSFADLEAAANLVDPGSEGTIAVLGPTKMNMSSVGLRTGGILFPIPVTMNERSQGHLARAALESAAYSIKANMKQLEDVTRRKADSICIGGGMVNSDLFTNVLANVLDADILVLRDRSASAMGAFVCSMTALGEYDSLSDGARRTTDMLVRVSPSDLLASEYKDHYNNWLEASSALDGVQL